VVSQIKVGRHGVAYVIDAQGRLIAHPDISLVLRNTDLSRVAHVQAARLSPPDAPADQSVTGIDLRGHKVFSTHARVAPLGWLVFAEMPVEEALAPLYGDMIRSGLLLLAALAVAGLAGLLLARRMVVPIQTLRDGAARIGSG